MAGTVVQTHERRGDIGVITLTCTGDASTGAIPATVLETKISGELLQLETNPGSPAPTDNYDITLVDEEGYDVLEGAGANRDTANTEKANIVFSGGIDHPVVERTDDLTFTVANQSVASAVLVAKLYYRGTFDT